MLEKARGEWERFTPQLIETDRPGPYRVPVVASVGEPDLLRLHERSVDGISPRHNEFLKLLSRALSNRRARPRMTRTRLPGFSVRVHLMIAAPLARVNRELRRQVGDDHAMRAFVASRRRVGSQNWRWVAGTRSSSRHAYGIALDLIPRSYGGRFSSWRWTAQAGITDW